MDPRAPQELDAAIDAELEFHFAEVVEGLMERGWSEAAARKEAQRRFGDRVRYREDLVRLGRPRRQWRGLMRDTVGSPQSLFRLDSLLQDARYAVRTLTRSPAFSVVALLALALGIGANTAVFSVVNAVLLRPLPFAEPDRLVMVSNYRPRGSASIADFLDWRARSQSLESLDAFEVNPFTNNRFTWTGDGEPEKLVGYRVTAGFFRTLGVQPILGRTFVAGEDDPGRSRTVVLSERLWRPRYGANPDVLGRQVVANGRGHTIVGVIPSSFEFWDRDTEIWAILPVDSANASRTVPAPGSGPAQARRIRRASVGGDERDRERHRALAPSELQPASHPRRPAARGRCRQHSAAPVGAVRRRCARSADCRVERRQPDARTGQRTRPGDRHSAEYRGQPGPVGSSVDDGEQRPGAHRGALGTALAVGGAAILRSMAPADLPRVAEIGVSPRVLAFTLLASVLSAVFFGLIPSLTASGWEPGRLLKEGGRGGESRRQSRARAVLVAGQVTLAVVLLIGAGLLIRSFSLLGGVDAGFNARPERVLMMLVSPTGRQFAERAALHVVPGIALERVRAVPWRRVRHLVDRRTAGPRQLRRQLRHRRQAPAAWLRT